MEARSRYYFKHKKAFRNARRDAMNNPRRGFYESLFDDLFDYNMCGTWTGLDANRNVVIRKLTFDEIMDLKEKVDKGEVIPEEISYYIASKEGWQ